MSVGCVVNVLNESELRKKKKPLENVKIAVNISGKISNKIFCGYCGKVFSQLSVCLFFIFFYCCICHGFFFLPFVWMTVGNFKSNIQFKIYFSVKTPFSVELWNRNEEKQLGILIGRYSVKMWMLWWSYFECSCNLQISVWVLWCVFWVKFENFNVDVVEKFLDGIDNHN